MDDEEREYGDRAKPTRELLAGVWAAYALDGEPRIESSGGPGDHSIRDLGGGFTLNLLAARHGRAVVVRVYRSWVSVARLADLQRIRDLLRDAGIPIPALVPTTGGQPWCMLEGRLVEADEYVANDANMDSWPRLTAAMPTLGRIHSALCDIDAAPETRCPEHANAVDAIGRIRSNGSRRCADPFVGRRAAPAFRRMCDEVEEITEIVAAAEAILAADAPPARARRLLGWQRAVPG